MYRLLQTFTFTRRMRSHTGWHTDDEPLFGERGEAKLIASVSFGIRAHFKWKGKSCSDGEASSCWLEHGDLLVMDGQCQDEIRHCTNPSSQPERINVTFRWIRRHVISCLFLRTGCVVCQRVRRVHPSLFRSWWG